MANEKITYPKLLACERKIAPSDGIFYGCDWENRYDPAKRVPLTIEEKSVRGTISNQLDFKKDKAEEKLAHTNLQCIDYCMLPSDADTLMEEFTVKFLSGVSALSSCNSATFNDGYIAWTNNVLEDGVTVQELALRYAQNIANARFLWRNRVGADDIEVLVTVDGNKKFTFHSLEYSIRSFASKELSDDILELAGLISETLASKEPKHLILTVQAFSKLGYGQEIFPSQEMVRDTNASRKKGEEKKSRFLYSTFGQAAMHSQKIGNALRTIDTWYNEGEESLPIAVECYGAVTAKSVAYRMGNNNFYALFKDAIVKGKELSQKDKMYVLAVLLRGGVFGDTKEA